MHCDVAACSTPTTEQTPVACGFAWAGYLLRSPRAISRVLRPSAPDARPPTRAGRTSGVPAPPARRARWRPVARATVSASLCRVPKWIPSSRGSASPRRADCLHESSKLTRWRTTRAAVRERRDSLPLRAKSSHAAADRRAAAFGAKRPPHRDDRFRREAAVSAAGSSQADAAAAEREQNSHRSPGRVAARSLLPFRSGSDAEARGRFRNRWRSGGLGCELVRCWSSSISTLTSPWTCAPLGHREMGVSRGGPRDVAAVPEGGLSSPSIRRVESVGIGREVSIAAKSCWQRSGQPLRMRAFCTSNSVSVSTPDALSLPSCVS